MTNLINKKCIFRGDRSGVFYGTLVAKDGKECEIKDCRRLWYWDGANSISDIALIGTTKPNDCKFTKKVGCLVITDTIEIIPCSDKAIKVLDEVKEWTRA